MADYLQKDPQEVQEQELERYLLYRRNESRWKPATLRLCYAGIKFYFRTVLDRKWKLFSILHAEDQRPLPVVLTQEEVIRILRCVKTFHNYAFLSVVYACGLRLGEALALTVDDIDARAMLVHVRAGEGRKDRTVPLPEDTLALLRRYWRTHRHPMRSGSAPPGCLLDCSLHTSLPVPQCVRDRLPAHDAKDGGVPQRNRSGCGGTACMTCRAMSEEGAVSSLPTASRPREACYTRVTGALTSQCTCYAEP